MNGVINVVKKEQDLRVKDHPILKEGSARNKVSITVEGKEIEAFEGEPIAAALLAADISVFRKTKKRKDPRGPFCGIGLCTDCVMKVDGEPNVRTCITPVEDGMVIEKQGSTEVPTNDT